ncbi:C1 family peptidase [Streptomyces sp. SL13]|uniref:Aminopeptidase n=1 Tax=Streptantibioticus silvisoli TaxID=2705255 RepID=A0AA90H4X1_9ACTN|nr:C1 family peptidase [Streptantibioticus silvisoli]MDI5961231.1 C1 family peptidase [Streptantibioticus silvisoli]MDI5971033.1 C1 family peptidase [Streptantibioticus silvisoli]
MDRSLTPDQLELFEKGFAARSANRLMQNAVTQTPVDDVALDRRVVTGIDHSVSHHLDDWKVTNQKKSGRCWMFAGLNLLRVGAARKLGVKDFEFSQNYLLWWDKFERANHFLEAVVETSDREVDDRTVAHLLSDPIGDGGQWNMFVALVAKHGLVPKSAMPETHSSSATRAMNLALKTLLRQGARDLRALAAEGVAAQRECKREVLAAIHRVLSIHLGTPPQRFLWQWEDKDKEFHRDGWLTPAQFAASYAQLPLEDYVCLVHDPRESSPVGRTFTVQYLGNVVDAPPVVYLNAPMELLKRLTMTAIVDGEPVWFGCDVSKMSRSDVGVWDAALYDYAGVYDAPFTMDKADRLLHHETQMTHAMLFTGVDVVDGSPRRWRVENSWGAEKADRGFWTMNDSWFGEYVFEIAVRRSALPPELAAALDQPPIVLPAWDPMGALAD